MPEKNGLLPESEGLATSPGCMANTRFFLLSLLLFCGCRATPPTPILRADRSLQERAYDWTLGEWHGFRRSAARGMEEPMTMRVTPILAGVGQLREMEIPQSNGVYRGLALQVYDPAAERWVRQYVNDVRRSYSRLEGGPEGPERSLWRSATPGRTVISKVESERLGPDRWRRTVSRSEDGGATWTEVFTDELARTGDRK